MSTIIDEEQLKVLIKAAISEALVEERTLVKEIIEDAIEEIALARAIDEGVNGKTATRDEIFHILESAQ